MRAARSPLNLSRSRQFGYSWGYNSSCLIVLCAQGRTGLPACPGQSVPKTPGKLSTIARTEGLVGRTPRSAADAPVGLLAPCKMLIWLFRLRDDGVPRSEQRDQHLAGRQ